MAHIQANRFAICCYIGLVGGAYWLKSTQEKLVHQFLEKQKKMETDFRQLLISNSLLFSKNPLEEEHINSIKNYIDTYFINVKIPGYAQKPSQYYTYREGDLTTLYAGKPEKEDFTLHSLILLSPNLTREQKKNLIDYLISKNYYPLAKDLEVAEMEKAYADKDEWKRKKLLYIGVNERDSILSKLPTDTIKHQLTPKIENESLLPPGTKTR